MSITAQSVARRVVDILQDSTSVRWPLNEVVRAINDGQMAILDARPDLFTATVTQACVAGIRQTIPATAAKLLRVSRNNSASSKRAVRIAVMEMLDAQAPDWQSAPQSAEIAHYMVDQRDARAFYVYPPASTAATLDMTCVNYPTTIAEPGAGTSLPASSATDTTGTGVIAGYVSVPDEIATGPLVDWVLARLLSKNGVVGDLQRASVHYQAFAAALGIELKGRLKASPISNSPLNPLYPAISQPGE